MVLFPDVSLKATFETGLKQEEGKKGVAHKELGLQYVTTQNTKKPWQLNDLIITMHTYNVECAKSIS